MSSKIAKTRLGDIEYKSIGKGIPIVFIHGGHSNCFEFLSHKGFDPEQFQLITPSRPGYGRTPFGDNRTPELSAELIIELINFLSLDSVIVYGISAGGPTALALAAHFPERVSKLILASAVSKKWLDENDPTYTTAQMIFTPPVEKFVWGAVKFFSRIY